MSESPYVYNDRATRQQFADQANPVGGYPNTQNVYAQIPVRQQHQQPQHQQPQPQQQQAQQQPQQQPQAQAQSSQQTPQTQPQAQTQPSQATQLPIQQQQQQHSPVEQASRAYPYSGANNAYSQYDPSQGGVYQNSYGQPYQQYPNVYQQPLGQVPLQQQQYANNQPSSGAPNGPSAPASNTANVVPYNQPNAYNPYQINQAGYAPAPYGYAGYPAGVPIDQSHLAGGLANVRGHLQTASGPIIEPNQYPQRPKLTTTFWEDEGTVCYQVESRGISVSRREDTNFINGTKLLNVAGMTRGRRDGILKSEKVRYVVKIGAMNLKGVWIPFERALELSRNEGIVDLLYPLFVKDIKELYQGPQFSGGLTAAANQNPKNIVPVQVTNTTYIPHVYPSRDKKKPNSSTSQTSSDNQQDSHKEADSTTQNQQPQQQSSAAAPNSYGYNYSYPPVQEGQSYLAQDSSNQYRRNYYYPPASGASQSKEEPKKD